jgi:phage terminase small subunit
MEMAFVQKVIEAPDRNPVTSARMAGYSIASSYPTMHRLLKDPRVIAALAERGIDVTEG